MEHLATGTEAINRRMARRLDDKYCSPGPREHTTSIEVEWPFGDSRPQCPSQGAPQQDHRRGAPPPASAATCGPHLHTLRGWCVSHEAF
eukprot:933523-Prymnesium_polylepis.1